MPEPISTDVPRLRTERLVLRAHSLDDFAATAAMWASEDVVRFIGGRPSTREESWARLMRTRGQWALLGFGLWAVEERATGRFIGEVGFGRFERDIDPPIGATPEGAWVLAPEAHGRGLASEALRAAHAWADAHLGVERLVCLIAPDNAPSLAVARKLGYVEYARAPYKGDDCVLLERATPR